MHTENFFILPYSSLGPCGIWKSAGTHDSVSFDGGRLYGLLN